MNEHRRSKLRRNGRSPVFEMGMSRLREETEQLKKLPYVPFAVAIGQWTHEHHCHADGSALRFDWEQPLRHLCPVCGKVYTGEPFDGCWVSIAHNRIGKAVYYAALLYTIEPDAGLLEMAKSCLLAYAEHYDSYEVHGSIPYNGPGKLFAQTLDEAHWILDLAAGFDLLEERFTPEEAAGVRSGLLKPCAEFLIANKENQIHNHAVLITSAICTLGILLGDEAIIAAGHDWEYGLRDQMDRGILGDGFWYEGSLSYHFYALRALLGFALVAEGSAWCLKNDPHLKSMFDFPLHVLLPGGWMPSLNDAGPADRMTAYAPYYEAALDLYGDDRYRALLQASYTGRASAARDSLYALLFGEEGVLTDADDAAEDKMEALMRRPYSSVASGLTKLTHPSGWHALIKHGPFGGEHDHLDQLGMQFGYNGKPVLTDPGTAAYGVPAHYGWFKHTLAHNTVSVGGYDQPPRDGQLIQRQDRSWGSWLEVAVDWQSPDYRMKGQIILPDAYRSWEPRHYEGVSFRRIIALADHLVLDIVLAESEAARVFCHAQHMQGTWEAGGNGWVPSSFAFGSIDDRWLNRQRARTSLPSESFRLRKPDNGMLHVHGWCSVPSVMTVAETLDIPMTGIRTTLINATEAVHGAMFISAYVHEADEEGARPAESDRERLRVRTSTAGTWHIDVESSSGNQRFTLQWGAEAATFLQAGTTEEEELNHG
ncbi:hypothetical protein FHS18_003582 [Paenibacillus phyllosphaerae]|uniref:Heparinase II/III-like C-terminal domain-containing protein n=1 Tax=Paenibacillus phyllosphaerae TaxID=274593 RepID=A0A7W5AZA5_9BACL|nr:heparinase II/III family protein [Paenibacillus phyllosphaerae]MBB3111514.1 hypothetical protein [Paenibacillus phyllosphaerae]